jgi:hypothetical protein
VAATVGDAHVRLFDIEVGPTTRVFFRQNRYEKGEHSATFTAVLP